MEESKRSHGAGASTTRWPWKCPLCGRVHEDAQRPWDERPWFMAVVAAAILLACAGIWWLALYGLAAILGA